MMNLFNLYKHTLLKTNFTKRMSLNIAVTDAFPRSAITLPCVGITLVLLVTSVLFLLMFLAEPSVSHIRTAGMMAWMLSLSWHGHPSFS
jgi:hypothetical protein